MFLFSFFADCDCPPSTKMEAIPATTCKTNIGQIQRFFIVRAGQVIWDTGTPANNIPATIASDALEDITGWNTLFTAVDDTFVAKTPLVGGDSAITAGTPITNGGGDNTTLNGETQYNGVNPAEFVTRFDSLSSEQIAAFRKIMCEPSIEVYLVNNAGKVFGWKNGDLVTGIVVTNFFLGTKTNAGFGTRDASQLTFQLPANYDEYLYSFEPSGWKALTE